VRRDASLEELVPRLVAGEKVFSLEGGPPAAPSVLWATDILAALKRDIARRARP
jgi:hypothetical protein